MVMDGQDLLEALPPYVLDLLARVPLPSATSGAGSLTSREEKVLKLLSSDTSIHFDLLLSQSDLGFAELNQLLLQLEMKGFLRQLLRWYVSAILHDFELCVRKGREEPLSDVQGDDPVVPSPEEQRR